MIKIFVKIVEGIYLDVNYLKKKNAPSRTFNRILNTPMNLTLQFFNKGKIKNKKSMKNFYSKKNKTNKKTGKNNVAMEANI